MRVRGRVERCLVFVAGWASITSSAYSLMKTTSSANKFLSTFSRNSNKAHYLNAVSINGKEVFGTGMVSVPLGECVHPQLKEGLKSVEVCGVQFRAIVFLQNNCMKEDPHQIEVGVCDGTKAADSCVKVNDSDSELTEFVSNSLSYTILHCDPEVPAPPVDTSGHSTEDQSEAAQQADGDVAEAEMAAETAVAESAAETAVAASEPPPPPAPLSVPAPPVPQPAVVQQVAIPSPPAPRGGLEVSFGPSDPVFSPPTPPMPSPMPSRGASGGFQFNFGGSHGFSRQSIR